MRLVCFTFLFSQSTTLLHALWPTHAPRPAYKNRRPLRPHTTKILKSQTHTRTQQIFIPIIKIIITTATVLLSSLSFPNYFCRIACACVCKFFVASRRKNWTRFSIFCCLFVTTKILASSIGELDPGPPLRTRTHQQHSRHSSHSTGRLAKREGNGFVLVRPSSP